MRGAALGLGAAAALLAGTGLAAPRGAAGPADPDTRQWWALTGELASDAMGGRDTGSPEYDRAARLVARRFAAAGLKPAGPDGSWFQTIAFDDLRLDSTRSAMTLGGRRLRFNEAVTITPDSGTPARLAAPATFRGYCGPGEIAGVKGQLVLCYGRPAPARLAGFDRLRALREAGAVGMLLIAAPGLPGEPIRWPFAYSRSVTFAGSAPVGVGAFLSGTLNPAALAGLIPDARTVLARGAAGADLPRHELGRFTARFVIEHRNTRSANVLGLLPGTDPALADQAIVVAAHLDGYGRGAPVAGDRIYNGALDDAAYVALLERLAQRRGGRGFPRPVRFAAFTGEEKGLLGSTWYVRHPTVPLKATAAVINLDQIRPLYPLRLMTVHGLSDSTLGDQVRTVANGLGIAVQEDPEPERNLLRRSDNWPFMRAGIPARALSSLPLMRPRGRAIAIGTSAAITTRPTISPPRSTGRPRRTSTASSMPWWRRSRAPRGSRHGNPARPSRPNRPGMAAGEPSGRWRTGLVSPVRPANAQSLMFSPARTIEPRAEVRWL